MNIPGRQAPEGGSGSRRRSFGVRLRRGALVVVLLSLFFGGYALVGTVPVVTPCAAASSDPLLPDISPDIIGTVTQTAANSAIQEAVCPCALPVVLPSPCLYRGQTQDMVVWLGNELRAKLSSLAQGIEAFIGDWLIDSMMATMLTVLNQAELNLIDWWDTFWFYNLNPALQDMTRQFSVSLVEQVRAVQQAQDARVGSEVQQERRDRAQSARKDYQPSENAVVVATVVGGQHRALSIGESMQKALQFDTQATALNSRVKPDGSPNPAAMGRASALAAKRAMYERTFCDPNGGQNRCNGAPEEFFNIDTQVTRQIYAKLTIDLIGSSGAPQESASVDPGFNLPSSLFVRAAEAADVPAQGDTMSVAPGIPTPTPGSREIPEDTLNALLENMLGDPTMDPIAEVALKGTQGQERYLKRRSFIARYNALRSAPQIMIGRRMPGSQLGPGFSTNYIGPLREAAGVQPSEISPNPSYREAMHAMTVDRFNSGNYATGMITDQSVIEREKLVGNALYLMQLRDYYELLERQALTLAVQVAILADQAPLPTGAALRQGAD